MIAEPAYENVPSDIFAIRAYYIGMAIIDIVYDVVSGVLGTLFGVAVTLLATSKRTRETNDLLVGTQKKVDALSLENERLIGALRDREKHILELERQILQAEKKAATPTKKRAK